MNIVINRLDPNVPDPIESRRRAAGRFVRFAYATVVFGVLAFFVIYFGRPLVYLSGPGTVSSPRYVVSLPYTVQVNRIDVEPGAAVQAGAEIGMIRSPQHDNIVATYMRALADIAGRRAEMRIKARVAHESLEAARSYMDVTEKAMERLEGSAAASLTFRVDILRERAAARKAVVSQEAEAAESGVQLATLGEFEKQMRARFDEVDRSFAGGRVFAPVAGIISKNLAHTGQSLVAGAPIAEILVPTDVFVDWYIPNERLSDPAVGRKVLVLFGNRRIPGRVTQILPISAVYSGAQSSILENRPSTQIARVSFDAGASPPALNSTVWVHMHYSDLSARIADGLIRLFGFH